jgi:mannose-6-phosphate isomerase-like protein (cupin superfamily)
MEHATREHAQVYKNSTACSIHAYPILHPGWSVAYIEINGRYPEQGWALNEVCAEMVYILSGSGKLVTSQQATALAPQDVVLVSPGEHYYWEGVMTMTISCTPAFYAEQHKIIRSE